VWEGFGQVIDTEDDDVVTFTEEEQTEMWGRGGEKHQPTDRRDGMEATERRRRCENEKLCNRREAGEVKYPSPECFGWDECKNSHIE
jgi:hypothetical protein